MWDTILNINSVLTAIACVYALYAIGAGILTWNWEQVATGIIVAVFFGVLQFIIGAFAD